MLNAQLPGAEPPVCADSVLKAIFEISIMLGFIFSQYLRINLACRQNFKQEHGQISFAHLTGT